MTVPIITLTLSTWLATSPPTLTEPREETYTPANQARSRRLFIASGVLMGAALFTETTGAVLATRCSVGNICAAGFKYAWGSEDAGTRFTMITTGPGSAYVAARLLSIPMVWTGEGLLLAGTHFRARSDFGSPASRRVGWALLGTGLGIYIASRFTRWGFALAGICQDPLCVYGFDQATLSATRALAFSGSAFVLHHRSRARMRFELGPVGTLGFGVSGQF